LTILTVNKNNYHGLIKTLDSLLNYDKKKSDFHLIIDGNSNDFDLSLHELQNRYNFDYISEKDNGIYNAMNKGIIISKSNRLLFLNSGDSIINATVFKKFITSYPDTELVYSNILKVLENGIEIKTKFPRELTLDYMISYGLPHQATIINRSLFDKIGLYNEDYKIISDWVFFMEALFYHNASYKYVNEDVVYFDGAGISNQSEYLKSIIREQLHYISRRFPNKLSSYKLNSPYVKKHFRSMPRWNRFIFKTLFLYFNYI
jgi:hypothetical protein